MSRILVDTTPARGHLFPATPIMDELHSRGHNIALRTLGSQVPMMRERGFDAAPIDPRIEEIAINDYLGRTPFDAQKRAMRLGRAEGAKRVAAAFAAAGGPKAAADAFEALDQALRARAAQGEREVLASRDDQDAPHRLDRQ